MQTQEELSPLKEPSVATPLVFKKVGNLLLDLEINKDTFQVKDVWKIKKSYLSFFIASSLAVIASLGYMFFLEMTGTSRDFILAVMCLFLFASFAFIFFGIFNSICNVWEVKPGLGLNLNRKASYFYKNLGLDFNKPLEGQSEKFKNVLIWMYDFHSLMLNKKAHITFNYHKNNKTAYSDETLESWHEAMQDCYGKDINVLYNDIEVAMNNIWDDDGNVKSENLNEAKYYMVAHLERAYYSLQSMLCQKDMIEMCSDYLDEDLVQKFLKIEFEKEEAERIKNLPFKERTKLGGNDVDVANEALVLSIKT